MPTTARIQSPSQRNPGAGPYDRAGLPLTTTSLEAAARYREATDRIHGAEAGAADLLEQAIALDPAFAMAHAARWMLAHAEGEAGRALVAGEAALSSWDVVTAWERGHILCVAAMIERHPDAWQKVRNHLSSHPGDLLTATQLIGDLFFNGRGGKREAVMDVLRSLAPHHQGDWAFAARLGFHTSELGDPHGAIEILKVALGERPQAPFVAHAMAHALLESGERDASYRFLRDWAARNDPAGPIDGHIHWHLSLGELERGEHQAALERYQQRSAPGTSHCALGLLLADAAGLFGRLALEGIALDGMPRAELRALVTQLSGALRVPFVAVHAAALALVLGESEILDAVEARGRSVGADTVDAEALVVNAFKSYLEGDMQACLEALERDRSTAWEAIGGSNEERALIGKLHERAGVQLSKS